MHKFYFTNNFGGGGTNVARCCTVYKELFNFDNIGALINYYYLNINFPKSISFDVPLLREINKLDSISDFFNYVKQDYARKSRVYPRFELSKKDTSINGYLLDNGCGNILRDLLTNGEFSSEHLNRLIVPFHEFAEKLKFDIAISLDCAMKYTYRDGETKDAIFMELWKELASDEKINLSLIDLTLHNIRINKFRHKIYAPLHGFNVDSYKSYLKAIQAKELETKTEFDGYAIGGIANTKILKNEIWNVPSDLKKDLKSGYIVSKLCLELNKLTSKPIHVLGAGTISVLPFLIKAGAASSDCHSAWRRASDGGIDKAKILVPLLNDKLEFINKKNVLEYVKIKDLDSSMNFDFGMSILELKSLYTSFDDKEGYYFAEILAFYNAIKQYDLIIRFTEQYPDDYIERLSSTPDRRFNEGYKKLAHALSK